MFYAIAEDPEYWKPKINMFIGLGPFTVIDHRKSFSGKALCQFQKMIEFLPQFFEVDALVK